MSDGSSSELRLRRLVHRGSVVACGFVVDPALLGVAEARHRVLALWTPGATVDEIDGALVITGLRARRVRAELAPGTPLVDLGGVISAAPLEAAELAALRERAGLRSLVLVRDACAEVVTPRIEQRVDVGAWIDLGDVEVARVAALAAPPVRAAAPAPVVADLRAVMGVGAAAPGAAKAQQALARAIAGLPPADGDDRDDDEAAMGRTAASARTVQPSAWTRLRRWLSDRFAGSGSGSGSGSTSGSPASRRRPAGRPGSASEGHASRPSWLGRLAARLIGRRRPRLPSGPLGSPRARAGTGTGAGAVSPRPADAAPPRPGLFDRLRKRFAEWMWKSSLGDTLGRRHAAYLRNMLELFDRGDLDEALRHAIPLGGSGSEPGPLSLSPPRPRDTLDVPLTPPAGGASAIPVAEDATAQIRARYQAALARLEQLGRIDDAAFVLAVLLGDLPGAIALLERHGKHARAAQLAEARSLEPGLVVRLWFLAGERARAVAVARRTGAWADAISRLERAGEAPAAEALRSTWADSLAAAGDFAGAVDVAWSLIDARARLEDWIERGIAGGGTVAARLLIRKLEAWPQTFAAVAPRLRAILDAGGDPGGALDDGAWQRLAIANALLAATPSPELRAIARPAVRALIRDVGRGADGEAPALLPRLVRFSDDEPLRADQPLIAPVIRPPALVDRATPLLRRWPAGDAGVLPVHDAALLPGGRLLIALGELGVQLRAADGHTVAHFDQPATRLVISDHGTRALATIARGKVTRIARIDLVERRGRHWCDVELDGGASSFDGALWLVSRGPQLLAVDTTADRWTADWGVDTGAASCTIDREGGSWAAVAMEPRRGAGPRPEAEPSEPRAARTRGPGAAPRAANLIELGSSELWCYEGFTLRRRRAWEPPRTLESRKGMVAATRARPGSQDWVDAWFSVAPDEVAGALAGATTPAAELSGPDWQLALEPGTPIALEVAGRVAAVAQRTADGVVVSIVHLAARKLVARLALDAASKVAMRIADFAITVGDDRGRVIVLDLRSGAFVRDLRLA